MRKLYTTIAAVLLTAGLFAQAPQKMSYQCVVRNSGGALVTSHSVGIRTTILQGTPSGTVVYQETYSPAPQTNVNGLATIEIGGGTPVTGTFSAINWAAGPYYLRTETDPTGGTSYTITGTSQLLSVPYALNAKTAENGSQWLNNGSNIYFNTGKVGIGTTTPPYNFSVNGGSGNGDISIHTTYSGNTLYDGLRIGSNSSNGAAWIWNYENNELYLGTNDLRRMTILGNGNVGIGDATPDATLEVNGTVKVGTNGINFTEIIEVTGTTGGAGTYFVTVAYPTGFTRVNTRVLSAEINAAGDVWVGLGFTNGATDVIPISYNMSPATFYLMYPNVTQVQSKAFRILLMKVE
jgi:hypothetical protein